MTGRTRWLLIGAGGSVLILVLGYVLVLRPAMDRLSAAEDAVAQQYAANELVVAELEQAKSRAAEVPAKMAEIEEVKTKLPPTMQQSELVRSLETAAIAAGVDLKRITAQTPLPVEESPEGTDMAALPYDLTATGTYDALKAYTSELERLPRAFLITDLYIGSVSDRLGDLTMTLSGNFYTLSGYEVPEPASVPSAAAPPAAGADGGTKGAGAAKKPRGKRR
jgi:Tfp pilus assembly protein PilO